MGPFPGDDRVELCSQQRLVGVHQFEELLFHTVCRAEPGAGDRGHGPHRLDQALMARRPSFLLLISILRGFACSATGIFSVRTPLS